MNITRLAPILVGAFALSACGEYASENSEEKRLIRERSTRTALIENAILGDRVPCTREATRGCRNLSGLLGHPALISAARCDHGTSIALVFRIPKEAQSYPDELFVIWHRQDANGEELYDTRRYAASIYGEEVAVGYIVGFNGSLSNREYRKRAAEDAPSAFAFLADHSAGDCVKLN